MKTWYIKDEEKLRDENIRVLLANRGFEAEIAVFSKSMPQSSEIAGALQPLRAQLLHIFLTPINGNRNSGVNGSVRCPAS